MDQLRKNELRGVILCADDYGLAPGVCDAIETLIAAGRLTATGAMTGLPLWKSRAAQLRAVVRQGAADVGLHITLTDHPAASSARRMVSGPVKSPGSGGNLPSLRTLLVRAYARLVDRGAVSDEIRAQLDAFEDAWNGRPDFVDGHQHVHLLPVVREILIEELVRRYPAGAVYVRNCTGSYEREIRRGVAVGKAVFISMLGVRFARLAASAGLPMNDEFSGLHDFSDGQPFRGKMRRFLKTSGARPLVHVHPGYVDDELRACDSLVEPRVLESDYLASDAFPEDLATANLRLSRFANCSS